MGKRKVPWKGLFRESRTYMSLLEAQISHLGLLKGKTSKKAFKSEYR